jgi:hypothetical protein
MSDKEPTLKELVVIFVFALVFIGGYLYLFGWHVFLPCGFNSFDCHSLDGMNATQLDQSFQSNHLTGLIFRVGGGNKTVCRNDEAGCHCCVDAPPRFQNGDCL